jgi:beta-lactam-binding protein with PASTA domain
VFKKSFLFNLILIVLISIGLLYAFFSSLDWLTNHGKQTTVPTLMGKKLGVAIKELKKMGFKIQVDSTYQSYKDPLEVLFQEPEAGASVKVGRTIFLTVNRKTPPSFEMPDLVNMSFRNALLTMHSYNLEMGDTNFRPDVAAGAVLEQWVNGKPIAPGTLIPFGTRIDLVIGEGLSTTLDVPNLIGKTWGEVKEIVDSFMLTPNPIWEGTITDSNSAIVFMQQPEAINELDFRNSINEGDMLDMRIMQNPSQELLDKNQPGSKQLIGEDATDSTGAPIVVTSPSIPKRKQQIPDSLKKKKLVPGMNVHSLPEIDPKHDKNNLKGKNTKMKGSDVIEGEKSKVKPRPKPRPKPKPKNENTEPTRKSDNQIKDEFN